jgi:dihydroxy-acid dehydratase
MLVHRVLARVFNLEVKLNPKELIQRLASLPTFEPSAKTGYLKRYSDKVSSASSGAVFPD